MLERPNLGDAQIAGVLQAQHGISASAIDFLPIGNDVNAFSFKVIAADGTAYFLKVRRGEVNLPALTVPRFAQMHGVPAVAPITTLAGALWAEAGGFQLILYPFIEGENGMDAGMSDAQWVAFGAALRRLHDLALPAEIQAILPVEDFGAYPYYQDVLQHCDALIVSSRFDDAVARDLAAFWLDRAGEIMQIAKRARELGDACNRVTRHGVLCHADIHIANVMVEQNGTIHFIDWDQPVIAPKERDLMFIPGDKTTLFHQGYGSVEIDRLALAYYRHWWVVQDLGDYAERAFLMHDVGDEVRAHAAAGFKAMFNAGDAIDVARKSDEQLDT